MSDVSSSVRDRIIEQYKARNKATGAAISEDMKKAAKDTLFNEARASISSAADPVWYSEKFVGADDYLKKTKKKDIDISSLYSERDDWALEHKMQIPNLDSSYVWQHSVLYPALIAMIGGLKTLMVGGTGTGKSAFYKNLAASLNQPFYRLSCRGDMESDTILGRVDIQEGTTEFLLGEFTKAYTNGYLCLLDEVWKTPPSIAMTWQRVFERDGLLQIDDMRGELSDKQFFPHQKTYLALADNVVGTGDNMDRFAATNLQDSSTLNRVDLVLRLNYLPQHEEIAMLCERYNFLPETKATKMVQLANLVRQNYEKGEVEVTMSPRNLMAWAEMAYKVQSYEDGFRYTMLERYADEGEKSSVKGLYQTVFGTSL